MSGLGDLPTLRAEPIAVDRRSRTAPHGDPLAAARTLEPPPWPASLVEAMQARFDHETLWGAAAVPRFVVQPWHKQLLEATEPGPVLLRSSPRPTSWGPCLWNGPIADAGRELTRGRFLLASARNMARGGEDVGECFADLIDAHDRRAARTRYATIRRRSCGAQIPFVVPVPASVDDADEWFRDDTACANGMGS